MDLPTPDDVRAAAARLAPHIVRTPMLRNALLDEITGGTILLKGEPLQRTGSFKLRGATNAILQLTEAQRAAGVVTHSSGNHGQAVACAAAGVGAVATIFMPQDAPRVKQEATARWGGQIRHFNRATADREGIARQFAEDTGATLVPPYDHPHVMAGQGTLALELAEDARLAGLTMDDLLVCTGGGGLISGCALGMQSASPATKIYCVEPADWNDTALSLAAGERVQAAKGSTLCDALLANTPGKLTFEINRHRLSGGYAVTDAEVYAAIAFAFTHLKLVVEPGGAVCLAALLAGHVPSKGRVIGAVLSGGNIDPAVFARAFA